MLRPLALALSLALAAPLLAQEPGEKPEQAGPGVGETAPTFEAVDDEGKPWRSAEHVGKGKVLVVYFYPADMTGGCTAQACSYRDATASLRAEGIEVVGVSGDSAENHRLFKREHKLPFTLLADPEGRVAKAFGVPTAAGGEIKVKTGDGEATLARGVTARRWTFVIGPDGKLLHRDTRANPARDARQVRLVAARAAKTVKRETPAKLLEKLELVIGLLEAGDARGFLLRGVHPDRLSLVLARGKTTLDELAKRLTPGAQANAKALAGCRGKAAEVLPAGDLAVFDLGKGREVWFELREDEWFVGE